MRNMPLLNLRACWVALQRIEPIMNKQQQIIIAAIVAATGVAGAAIWMKAGTGQASQAEAKPAHGDKDHHEEGGRESHEQAAETHVVKLSPEQIAASGIQLGKVAAGVVRTGSEFPGEVRFNADRTAQITPRVSGVVEAVSADLGQVVRKGQVLAVIASAELSGQRAALLAARERAAAARTSMAREKRLWEQKISAEQDYLQAQQALREAEIELRHAEQSLQAIGAGLGSDGRAGLSRYEVRAPFDGTIVEKHITQGEALKSDANAFLISDLSQVWVALSVPMSSIEAVRVGAQAIVNVAGSGSVAKGKVSHVGSLLGTQTRAATARITLTNPQGAWRPGLFVTVNVLADEARAAMTVRSDAVQIVEDKPVVFVRTADGFEGMPVKLGRTDGTSTEILSGLSTGQDYAIANSFLLKAELGKGSAEHDH
jgi:cobalt-zinc-cadmium efflux system membrane fusion protein